MVNEIVKFSNQFNNVALRKFDSMHLDVLMAIASRVKEKGTETVTFTFEEMRSLMRLKKNLTNAQLAAKIIETNRRLLALNYEFTDDEGGVVQFALFTVFRTTATTAKLEVSVNQLFAFLLNDLTSNFTRFELKEFAELSSRYAKECYRRVKQYRQTGVWKVSLEDFKRLMDVPKSYRVSQLNQFVLQPIEEELGDLIHLKVERVYKKKGSGRGRSSLVGFEFHFDKEFTPDQQQRAAARAERAQRDADRAAESSAPKFDIAAYKAAHDGRTPRQQAIWEAEQGLTISE